jgi:hypothetical protein
VERSSGTIAPSAYSLPTARRSDRDSRSSDRLRRHTEYTLFDSMSSANESK